MEPEFRCSTKKALDELSKELNLKEKNPDWDSIAGYSYTPGNPEDLQQYLDYYLIQTNEDKKFTLMEMMLDAIAQQSNEADFLNYWGKLEPILVQDYSIHEFTIYYWRKMTVQSFERSNIMTPLIQQLITQKEAEKKFST